VPVPGGAHQQKSKKRAKKRNAQCGVRSAEMHAVVGRNYWPPFFFPKKSWVTRGVQDFENFWIPDPVHRKRKGQNKKILLGGFLACVCAVCAAALTMALTVDLRPKKREEEENSEKGGGVAGAWL
jgi:hypothetical protein